MRVPNRLIVLSKTDLIDESLLLIRIIFYGVMGTVLLLLVSLASVSAQRASAREEFHWQRYQQSQLVLSDLLEVVEQQAPVAEKLNRIDSELPGLSTNELDLLLADYRQFILAQNFDQAGLVLGEIDQIAGLILNHQNEILTEEVGRLQGVLQENLVQIVNLLGNPEVVPSDAMDHLKDERLTLTEKLDLAREWVSLSAGEIQRRRAEVDQAQKQVLVRKSEKRLYMFENGREVYSMPISTGRYGAATKSGEFAVLDKLGTVWSFWQIWLPYWMGIYYVGSSENGIHGLPYSNQGRTYWASSVGVDNVTYGCVMPNDLDMVKLYEWAEVGTPVTIIN